jgi:23S rRNA pseudouridine2605 synthase
MTNDGDLANRLTHPRYEVDKCYIATVKERPSEEVLSKLRTGIKLEDGWTAPARVKIISSDERQTTLELVIHEGRNRQIRRMLEAVGHPVQRLVRTRLAFLTLKGLRKGEYRELTLVELTRLKQILK